MITFVMMDLFFVVIVKWINEHFAIRTTRMGFHFIFVPSLNQARNQSSSWNMMVCRSVSEASCDGRATDGNKLRGNE